jgi:hypothetical protein
MANDTTLIEKREELKRRLAAGEYKTLVDVLFDWMSRVIQKITRTPHPISPWTNSIILCSLVFLPAIATLFLMGDTPEFLMQLAIFPQGTFALMTLLMYLTSLLMVAGNLFVHRAFATFCESVLDATETVATLDDFTNWLTSVCNRKLHFIASLVGGVLSGIYVLYIYKITFRRSFPISIDVGFILFYVILFVFLYLLLYMAVLSARVGQYHLKLHTTDPGNSEVISRLARLFSNLVYLAAIYAAFYVFIIAFIGLLTQFIMLLVLLLWIPLTIAFILYQSSLSRIIRRSKWGTLNEIQIKIEKLHASEKLGEKETMETINRLIDYYDRIKSTRSSRVDTGAVLNLINSLLLPLLALVLGNIDRILAIFK